MTNLEPIGVVDTDFDFSETLTEKENGWSLDKRCGQNAISGGSKDQRGDKVRSLLSKGLLIKINHSIK